jgi:hypothetical protein
MNPTGAGKMSKPPACNRQVRGREHEPMQLVITKHAQQHEVTEHSEVALGKTREIWICDGRGTPAIDALAAALNPI